MAPTTSEVSPAEKENDPRRSDNVLLGELGASSSPFTAAYIAALATTAEGWMHLLNMLALCDALILACAYTGLSWFENAVQQLTQCGRWDQFSSDLAFMCQFGLGLLIMCLLGAMGLNALVHGGDAEKGVVCSRAWKRYFPFFVINLLGVVLLFIVVAMKMAGIVNAQADCQHELWLTEMGSTTFCEQCVKFNVAQQAVADAVAAGAEAADVDALMPKEWMATWSIWHDGGGPLCWLALVPCSGVLCLVPLLWVSRRRR
jgi:hypothetical protein